MFCDLADSTAMASGLDPEDFREIVQAYHATTVKVVQDFGGHVAQYLGDGLLVYFGYPRAHENAAARAMHAAQGIVAALPGLNQRLALADTQRLRVRIGVHTGLVVVGDVGSGARHEKLAIGDAPNTAARLQSLAPPDGIVASAATRNLVREALDWNDLGLVRMKGIAAPMQVFSLGAASLPRGQLEVRETTPLVGRQTEAAFIHSAWRSATASAGSVVLVGGEPGIGKSRLLAAARELALQDQASVFVFRCSPYHTASDLHPVTEWLEQALGFLPEESGASRFAKVEQALAGPQGAALSGGDGRPGSAATPQSPAQGVDALGTAAWNQEISLLAGLLSLPLPAGREPPHLTPAVSRQRTQAALAHWLLAQALTQPLLLAFEDLHWADPSTLAFIQLLTAEVREARIMIVVTFRPEFTPPWPEAPRTVRLALERLPGADIEAIVRRVTGGVPLPDTVVRQIIAKTDGVPLFVEEFTRTLLESGALLEREGRFEVRGDILAGLIPESLRDSLAARLDRLGTGRAVARHAAVIGRRFDVSLVAQTSGLTADDVEEGVNELVRAGLIYRVDARTSSERYEFKHALVQAAAYDSLLRRERNALHSRVSEEMQARLPELVERQPELLAHHLTESQQWVPAAQRWLVAGQRCLARSANLEAIAHLRSGLALLEHLPPGIREGLELALLSTIGPALIATTGFGSPQVGQVYTRARSLCELMNDRPEFFPCLWGSWVFHLVSGQLKTSLQIAQQMLDLAEKSGDSAILVEAHWTMGNSLFWLGDLVQADHHLAFAARLYDPVAHAGNALVYGQDPAVAAECYRSYCLWGLGQADEALAALDRADALAAARDHIFSTGWALAFRFLVHTYRREPALALQAADRSIGFGAEHSHPFWTAAAMIVRGWAQAQLGDRSAGLAQFHEGLALYDATGSRVVQTLWYALLAELELDAGQPDQAAAVLDKGFAVAADVGERYSEIELWRLRGRWHAGQGRAGMAEARRCTERALAQAQACNAGSYALRAAEQLKTLQVGGHADDAVGDHTDDAVDGHIPPA